MSWTKSEPSGFHSRTNCDYCKKPIAPSEECYIDLDLRYSNPNAGKVICVECYEKSNDAAT